MLVIGGGIAGIQASLDLTELGFKVYLIEKGPSIGGRMAQFDKLFPTNDCSLCVLAPKMVAIYRNPNIELFTLSEVQKVTGSVGDFTAIILKKPRYVDEAKCRGCGDCAAKCPKIESPNIFDMNLGKRKSSYIPFPQATPPTYLIDPELCLYINRKVCGVCKKVCKADAINFEQKPQELTIKIGAIVVATGFDMLGEELSPKWGYKYENVTNALEYERILSSSGPFGAEILRPSDHKEPEKIAFLLCAGSTGSEKNVSYCSRVCCMYSAKFAINTKTNLEDSQISVFRHYIRVFGKYFYEYTKKSREEYGVNFIHSEIDHIEEDPDTKDLIIHYKDLKAGETKEFRANLVVLTSPIVPSSGTKELANILGIELDKYNFFKERSYFNNSLSTKDGIFLTGVCGSGPMNIPETVASASGVAGIISTLLAPAKYTKVQEKDKILLPEENIINITPNALIIGGGISGMTAALNISKQGFETYIIEKEKRLGGNLNDINIIYPTQQKASEFLNGIIKEIEESDKIQVFLNSQIQEIKGKIGKYEINLIDGNEKTHSLISGVIIVATGGQEFKPKRLFQYDEKNKNVITLLELEQKLKNNDDSWLDKINHITTILCVDARQKDGFAYCSNVCCINAIKNIQILKKIKPELELLVLLRDLQTAKKEFENIFNKRKKIAKFFRYELNNIPEITKISQDPEKYDIRLRDDLNWSNFIDIETDLIVLATPLIPSLNLKEIGDMLNVPLDKSGFFPEAHEKLRPLDFVTQGVFVCGCAQWPKNIQDSITQANGAAGRASRFLSKKQISTTKLEYLSFLLSIQCYFKDLVINIEKCNGCGRCAESDICSFNAITLVDTQREYEDVNLPIKKAVINSALCKGCGKCASVCRLKAIEAKHFDFKHISAMIDPYFLKDEKSVENIETVKTN